MNTPPHLINPRRRWRRWRLISVAARRAGLAGSELRSWSLHTQHEGDEHHEPAHEGGPSTRQQARGSSGLTGAGGAQGIAAATMAAAAMAAAHVINM